MRFCYCRFSLAILVAFTYFKLPQLCFSNFNMRPLIHVLLARQKHLTNVVLRVFPLQWIFLSHMDHALFLAIMQKQFWQKWLTLFIKQTWILSMFKGLFIFQWVSLILFRAARSCLFSATFNIQGITLSEVSLHFFLGLYLKKLAFLDHFTSYRHRLDSMGPLHQNQPQIRLDIHTCTIQRCYCRYNWLHKYLGTGIHLNLRIKGRKKFPLMT